MNSNIRIAKEMLRIAKELTAGDYADRNTYNQITKTKTTMPQFKQLKKVFKSADDEGDDLANDTMDKVAEELLEVARELVGDGEQNMKIYKANDAKDVFEMETSTKEIDKACKLMNEAILILRKWEAALAVRKLKGKVNTETGIDIDTLIDVVDKATDKALSYSIKLSVLKEQE